MPAPSSPQPPQPDRREFLTKAAAVAIGGALTLAAPVAGLGVLLDPLRHKSVVGVSVQVASLGAVPENGEPRMFPVRATLVDAWNRTPNAPLGVVFLQRLKDGTVRALNASCPHNGCFVDFRAAQDCYHCPCHDSTFSPDGAILDPSSPSPRGMDPQQVEIRNGTEIWVTFQSYRAGVKERIPV